MPLNVDRTSIGLTQAQLHEHALERPEARRAAAQAQDAPVNGDEIGRASCRERV